MSRVVEVASPDQPHALAVARWTGAVPAAVVVVVMVVDWYAVSLSVGPTLE
jgi:hypothetical protein